MDKPKDEKNNEPERQEQTVESGGTPAEGGASLNPPPKDEGNTPDKGPEDTGKPPRSGRGRKPAGGADGGENPPPPVKQENPPPPVKPGNTRMKCAALKGSSVIVGKGEPVKIDENGFFEVGEKEAARLLAIPGYEKA
ncbi:MAG: hypothetical protein LBK61_12245 [Spirochaetaceae bacterium]|jgi:hypothetical protein|nr:hypothetical protein [Spirochaetaceae bacterium]